MKPKRDRLSTKTLNSTLTKTAIGLAALVTIIGAAVALRPPADAKAPLKLIACAPGYPANTDSAQPTMDAFADAILRAAGWGSGAMDAHYYEDEKVGREQIAQADLALVPLPFFLEHGAKLGLQPLLVAVQSKDEGQVWNLIAPKGKVASPADLDSWTVAGIAGYSPGFIRGPALGSWGSLPSSVKIQFSPNLLSMLRRAAKGEQVAMLLDEGQSQSVSALPFADKLESVASSKPLPAALLCRVGSKVNGEQSAQLLEAFKKLHEGSEDDAALLSLMQIKRFVEIESATIEKIRAAYAAAEG